MIDKSKLTKAIKDKYSLENETFSRVQKDNPKDTIITEIGDSKQPDFKPQFKVMRWDNEVNFSMRAEEHPDAVVEVEGEKIKYITPDYEVHQYDKPDASEDGGFEFEWVLPKKPDSNVLTATIQTKGLDFFYQPDLTGQPQIPSWETVTSNEAFNEHGDLVARMEESAIGSYAAYHKTKGRMNRSDGMDYKVGKAFHIFRPKAIDASGVETWCELNIAENVGILTVKVPQDFLDSAAYPVIVDPTFGYTTLPVSVDNVVAAATSDSSNRFGKTWNLPVAGTLDSITAALRNDDAGTHNIDTFIALNREDSAGTDSHDLVASVEELNKAYTSTTNAFITFTAAGESLSADGYIINVLGNGEDSVTGHRLWLKSESATASNIYTEQVLGAGGYASLKENPWTETKTLSNTTYGLYATYTEAGGGAAPTPLRMMMGMGT